MPENLKSLIGAAILGLLAIGVGLVVFAYIFGGPVGYARGRDVFASYILRDPKRESPSHFTGWTMTPLGPTSFWLPEGWGVTVEYEVEARHGSFRIALLESWAPIGHAFHEYRHVSGKQAGQVAFTVPRAGLYKLIYGGSVLHGPDDKSGHDVDYEITWSITKP